MMYGLQQLLSFTVIKDHKALNGGSLQFYYLLDFHKPQSGKLFLHRAF